MAATAGTVASATIPGDGNLYKACMLKNVGTIRLIDPSLPSGNLVSRCTSLETLVSWNQNGQPGPAGTKDDPGPQGPPGVFTGTLTSPNGAYSINVTDTGIVLRAPGATARLVGNDIVLASSSSTTVQAGTSFDLSPARACASRAAPTRASRLGRISPWPSTAGPASTEPAT